MLLQFQKGNFIELWTLKILGVSRTNKMLTYFYLWPLSVKWNSSMRHCVSRRETFVPSYFKIHQFIAKWGSRQTQSWPILTFDIEVWLRVLRYKCESSMRHSVPSMLTFVLNKLLIHLVMVKLESGQRKFQANLTFDQQVQPHRLRNQNDFCARHSVSSKSTCVLSNIKNLSTHYEDKTYSFFYQVWTLTSKFDHVFWGIKLIFFVWHCVPPRLTIVLIII